jgi:hypothetical protein
VAADAFKALAPFFFFAAWRNRQWTQASAAAMVWLVTMAFALTGATGHAALNRLDTSSKRDFTSTAYKDLRADYKRATDELSWVPAHRPIETVQAELNVLKAQRLWLVTAECKEAEAKSTREFCQGFHRLNAELASAVQGGKIQARIEDISGKLSKFSGGAPAEGDPQAGILARISGYTVDTMQGVLVLLLVLLLEVGSGLGPYVAWSYFPVRPSSARNVAVADKERDNSDSGPSNAGGGGGKVIPLHPAVPAPPALQASAQAVAPSATASTPAASEAVAQPATQQQRSELPVATAPPPLTANVRASVARLRAAGKTWREIGSELGRDHTVLFKQFHGGKAAKRHNGSLGPMNRRRNGAPQQLYA